MPVDGLDSPCGTCGRRSGDHTLDEWAKCLGTTTMDLPYEELDDAQRAFRERFGLDEDTLVADNVVVAAVAIDGKTGFGGTVSIKIPGVLCTFQVAKADGPPATVAKVVFIGDVDSVRGFGRLMRDSANGAVNAVGR